MASLPDYVNMLYRLLPAGDLWPTQEHTSSTWHNYARAIMSEFQRVDAKADEWLEDFLPDTTGDPGQLEDWERILGLPLENTCPDVGVQAESARRTEVLTALRPAAVTVAEVEALANPVVGSNASITQPALPVFYAGSGLAGQPLAGPGWASAYMYNYMDQLLDSADDFTHASWTTSGAAVVTANTWRAPDGTLSGDTLDGVTGGAVQHTLSGTADGDTIQFSVWLYPTNANSADVTIAITTRAGTVDAKTTDLPLGRWSRYEMRVDLGTGATTPKVAMSLGSSEVVYAWGAYCGVVSPLVECYTDRSAPLHTTALHRVTGDDEEYPHV